ncbi:MAG: hypothetical protein LBJ81_00950 [Puniceicoccales bacterium]|jgi:hypothetical protein|nr:hypothetical protein [Puniceicoccales bacterium]
MSDKEVNQLKRGRMQRSAREQKKSSSVGEITDPFIVLNDSISVKNRPQECDSGDYIPSESKNSVKTTSVDEPDPLLDLSEEPEIAKSALNSRRDRPSHAPRDPRYGDSKCHCSGRRGESREESRGEFRDEPRGECKGPMRNDPRKEPRGEHRNPARNESREESNNIRLKSDTEPSNRPRSGEKKCSCLGAIGGFFGKIMEALGLKSADQPRSQKNKTQPTDGDERPPSNASQNIHRKNYGHGRPRHQRTSPRKFQ